MSDDHNRAVDVFQGFERGPRALFIVGPRVVERQIRRDGVMPAGAETLYAVMTTVEVRPASQARPGILVTSQAPSRAIAPIAGR